MALGRLRSAGGPIRLIRAAPSEDESFEPTLRCRTSGGVRRGRPVPEGRVIGSRAWDAGALDLAPLATALAAARSGHLTAGLDVADLRQRRRRAPERRLVLVVLDCSGSMGARDRMAVTKAAILGLLGDAYRHRAHLIALTAFAIAGARCRLHPMGAPSRRPSPAFTTCRRAVARRSGGVRVTQPRWCGGKLGVSR